MHGFSRSSARFEETGAGLIAVLILVHVPCTVSLRAGERDGDPVRDTPSWPLKWVPRKIVSQTDNRSPYSKYRLSISQSADYSFVVAWALTARMYRTRNTSGSLSTVISKSYILHAISNRSRTSR